MTRLLCTVIATIYAARRLYLLAVSPWERAERRIDAVVRRVTAPLLEG